MIAKKSKEKILITAALPYANGSLHFGHIAGAYLPADCYARFERLRGKEVLYICGSDEYGVAITLSAEQAGSTPQAHVDTYHAVNQTFFAQLGISFDHFSRTTWQGHQETVCAFFADLLANGHIEARETEQLYSEKEQRFLADRYVIGQCPRCGYAEARGDECGKCGASYEATDLKHPCSKLTSSPLTLKKTLHYFLLFDHFKEQLTHLLKTRAWKPNVLNFAAHYAENLRPRAITRDLEWGIPVPLPEAAGKVFYVWFDAPIGYISATKEWAQKLGDAEAWRAYWLEHQTKYVQFIGKDNIPFHALFFPAMTLGQNTPYKIVDDLVANEFYLLEGRQFSKSNGWVINLESFFDKFTADQIRYAIAANAPETADAEFSWKDFQMRCNNELLGKFGNLINRVLTFLQQKCEGKIPAQHSLTERDHRFINAMERLVKEIEESYSNYRLRRVSQLIMELSQEGNAFFDSKEPWREAKRAEGRDSMETTLALCLECIKKLAIVSFPLLPATAAKIWNFIGFKEPIDQIYWPEALEKPLTLGLQLTSPTLLFSRIEDALIDEEIQKLKNLQLPGKMQESTTPQPTLAPPASLQASAPTSAKPEIAFADFQKLDLRVGVVLQATAVPKSKKLLLLEVDLGHEKRSIVSGIHLHYPPESLIGKQVIVIANLQPIKIMGVESHGMLLAGHDAADTLLKVITTEGTLPPGSIVS